MAAISHVFRIRRAAQILGRDEDLLWELSDQLEPEDGKLWVCDIDGAETPRLHPRWHRGSSRNYQGSDRSRRLISRRVYRGAQRMLTTFGAHTPIQRCQIHKARNVIERLPKPLHASVRRALRQAWELDDADKAERLLRNLARRLDQEAPGVAASILEGLDEILTVVRLKLPMPLRRSLACTNVIENMMGTVRRVSRNVKRWRNAAMALRWTAAGMMEASKGFRRLKAHKYLTVLRAALAAHQSNYVTQRVDRNADAA